MLKTGLLNPKRLFNLALLIVFGLFNSAGLAQETTKPAVSVVSKDDVIRISSDLIQAGITVLDHQGRFVPGLEQSQFQLLIDGKPQAISFFEQVTAGSGKEGEGLRTRAGKNAVAENSATPPTASTISPRRTVFFFIDDMHLAPDSIIRTQQALRRYVDDLMRPTDRVAITTASGQIGFLQQLTNDKVVLRKAIDRLIYRSYDVRDQMNPPMTEYQALAIMNNDSEVFRFFAQLQLNEICSPSGIRGASTGTGCGKISSGMTNNAVFDDSVARAGQSGSPGGTTGQPSSTQGTAGTFSTADPSGMANQAANLVRSRARILTTRSAAITTSVLSSLENLIRTAAPLPERKLVIFISDGFFINYLNSSKLYDLRRITDAAIRTGTVIYTVDAHGLTSGAQDATTSGIADRSGTLARINMGAQTAQQDIFQTLAVETGGDKWINSNAMDPGIAKAINETSVYYLLAWRPEKSGDAPDKFRSIEVQIKGRPDLIVRVQRGFLNGLSVGEATFATSEGSKSVDEKLIEAIRAVYPKSEFEISLSLGHRNTAKDGSVLAASMQIDSELLKGEVDVLGTAIDNSGKIVSTVKQHLAAAAGNSPLVYTIQFPGLVPGLYQVRVAACDVKTGRLGNVQQWMEVPEVKPDSLSMSSVFLSARIPASAASQAPMIRPDHRFKKAWNLLFQTYLYGAAKTAPGLTLEIQLIREGQIVTATPPSAVSVQGITDLARIPVVGEFPLESFSPGQYRLNVIVTDSVTKSKVSQAVDFRIE